MASVGDTLLGLNIGEDSVTWGGEKTVTVRQSGMNFCLNFPKNGFFKGPNEQSVLPHAIGCQPPTPVYEYCESCGIREYRSEYKSVLLGDRMIKYIFNADFD